MSEKFVIRYWYKNEKLSDAASRHVFRYLSAFCGCKFVQDENAPVIWRDTESHVPLSVRAILSNGAGMAESSDKPDGGNKDYIFVSPDPIERVFEKISLRTTLGPYSEPGHKTANTPEESLGGIIRGFIKRLKENDIIRSREDGFSLWQEGYSFALAVTHDVDIIRRSVPGSVRLLFNRDVPGGLRGLLDSVKSSLGFIHNPYDKIVDWMDHEKRIGLQSTFFIFPGNRNNKNDPKYKPDQLKRSIEYIKENGFELALHSGIECYRGDSIAKSRKILKQSTGFSISGIRPHYLSASLPEYWRAAAESGFEYSSCLGFDEEIGFRHGIDLPLMPFDNDKNVALEIVEIPIAIMDCGLIKSEAADYDELLENAKKLISRVKRVQGILVLDWHQRTMYNADYPGWGKIFFELIDYARNEGAYFITLAETARLLRSKMADGG